MVKKLFKHELYFYLRLLLPLHGGLLGVAALARIVQFFESDHIAYNIVNTSSILMFVMAMFACMLLTTIFCVVRFYKNLFTGEGYLTFTLPATPTQHLLVKLGGALTVTVLSVIGILLSVCIITAGDVLAEIVKAGAYLFRVFAGNKAHHFALYFVEFLLLLLIMSAYQYLVYYGCVSIGQTFRKNRVLGAVGMYFAYYAITQTLSTVVIILLTIFSDVIPWWEIEHFIDKHPYGFFHIFLWVLILFYGVMSVGFFFLNRRIIRRKLNLE